MKYTKYIGKKHIYTKHNESEDESETVSLDLNKKLPKEIKVETSKKRNPKYYKEKRR